jgi:RNA polymerase sigma factor (sigma-70 family)
MRSDFELIKAALSGDKAALNTIVDAHYSYTYNICVKMLFDPQEAEDANQELWIKIITRLKTFGFKSAFTTWIYKITVNHILDMKKGRVEKEIKGFEPYGNVLNSIKDERLTPEESISLKESVTEAKIGCMAGMLMCLDREQRLLYVMGDIFKIDHKTGSEIFNLTPANYRQKLSRARKELFNFMNRQCSLVNKNNPCVCGKKTKGFIKMGFVDPDKLIFNADYKEKIFDKLKEKSELLCEIEDAVETRLFQEHPYYEKKSAVIEEIMNDHKLKSLLELN